MTKVKFYTENDGEVFAYFPEMEYYPKGYGFDERMRSCYSHIGQHSACHPNYLKGKRLATENEYKDLLAELKGQGYNDLVIIQPNKKRFA